MIGSWTSTPDGTTRRFSRRTVWGALATLLVGALGLLALAVASRDDASPAPETASIRFRVVDEAGAPIPHAEVFVLAGEDLPPGGAGRWSDEDATLTLPAVVRGSAVAVQAQGYRSAVAQSVTADREFVLRRGIFVRLEARGHDAEAARDAVLVFQLNPAPDQELSDDQRAKIVDLVTTVVPVPEGAMLLPGGVFGFAVQASIAKQGLLLPLAGRYVVRWGLLDPGSGMWFTLPEDVRTVIDVADDERGQVFPIPVTADALQRTRKGLQERALDLGDR